MDTFYSLHVLCNWHLSTLEYGASCEYHLKVLPHYIEIEVFRVIVKEHYKILQIFTISFAFYKVFFSMAHLKSDQNPKKPDVLLCLYSTRISAANEVCASASIQARCSASEPFNPSWQYSSGSEVLTTNVAFIMWVLTHSQIFVSNIIKMVMFVRASNVPDVVLTLALNNALGQIWSSPYLNCLTRLKVPLCLLQYFTF